MADMDAVYFQTFPVTLFECYDGKTPMHFVFCLKQNYVEVEEIFKIMRHCGAKVSINREDVTIYSALITDHDDVVDFNGPAFTMQYITDCLDLLKLQDIGNYRQDATKHLKFSQCMDVVYYRKFGWTSVIDCRDKLWIYYNYKMEIFHKELTLWEFQKRDEHNNKKKRKRRKKKNTKEKKKAKLIVEEEEKQNKEKEFKNRIEERYNAHFLAMDIHSYQDFEENIKNYSDYKRNYCRSLIFGSDSDVDSDEEDIVSSTQLPLSYCRSLKFCSDDSDCNIEDIASSTKLSLLSEQQENSNLSDNDDICESINSKISDNNNNENSRSSNQSRSSHGSPNSPSDQQEKSNFSDNDEICESITSEISDNNEKENSRSSNQSTSSHGSPNSLTNLEEKPNNLNENGESCDSFNLDISDNNENSQNSNQSLSEHGIPDSPSSQQENHNLNENDENESDTSEINDNNGNSPNNISQPSSNQGSPVRINPVDDSSDSDIDCDDEGIVSSSKVTQTRKPYTREEQIKILRFIVSKEEYSRLKGREFWQVMEAKKVCRRTWQSMKEHFLKQILMNLDIFMFLTNEQKRRIQRACL